MRYKKSHSNILRVLENVFKKGIQALCQNLHMLQNGFFW